jgi:hypothetical protein
MYEVVHVLLVVLKGTWNYFIAMILARSFLVSSKYNALCTKVNHGLVGRPGYVLTQDLIQILRGELRFRWVEIAAILGKSSRTLNRRRHEFGMSVGQDYNFSSTEELDMVVSDILIFLIDTTVRPWLCQRHIEVSRFTVANTACYINSTETCPPE